jgi:ribulose-phosphate 3-epimerase
MPWIAPSLLSADFLDLGGSVREMEQAGARILHLDVMDGHFVPNLSFGLPVIEAVRKQTDLVLDVHLMISNPEEMADAFIDAGADYLSVQYETVLHLDRLMDSIREKGAQPGVGLNPHTPVGVLEEILPKCHHVMIMSVNPGFSGQRFIATSYDKMRKLKELAARNNLRVKIEIDGGIGPANTQDAVRAGAEILVAGSAIFGTPSPSETFRRMQNLADEASP